MASNTDMSTPVTRGELREELAVLKQDIGDLAAKQDLLATKQELAGLATKKDLADLATKQELAGLATKKDLADLAAKQDLLATKQELAGLATKKEVAELAAKVDLLARVTQQELAERATRRDLEIWGGALVARMDGMEHRLSAELARHARAIQESMQAQVSASDEKYADLPGRVRRLETTVFERKRR
jgi:hypothetical protein